MIERQSATATPRVVPLLVPGIVLVLLACALGWWLFSRGDAPFGIDIGWNDLVLQWWTPILVGFSRVMNWLGGGWFGTLVVPLGCALALILLRRPWAGAFFLTAEAISAGGVQILKQTFGRVRPEDMLVVSDYGSFPSGHVANAATLAVAAFIIFPRMWVVIVGTIWVMLMAFSRTYLHAHWLTDTVGGAMFGAGVALLVAAVFVVPMAADNARAASRTPSLG